jgi:tetratricopeptide (TPR) repeat protein
MSGGHFFLKVPTLITLGEVLATSQPPRAEQMLRRAIAIDGNEACAHLALGQALHAQAKPRHALACFERAMHCVGVSPQVLAGANMSAAALHEEFGELQQAVACLQAAAKATPDDHLVMSRRRPL